MYIWRMSAIRKHAYPRAALIGNPSDGYNGKTIAFVFQNYQASVFLEPSDRIEIVPTERDFRTYKDLDDLSEDVHLYGYYGGLRILKAAVKQFYNYVNKHQLHIKAKNFKLSYQSNIPNRLGLAGSSAIITAGMKALMEYYEVDIPKPMLANLVLSVETEELGISAGLQDRVTQVYQQPVYMDFDRRYMDELGFGHYETFSTDLLPNLYIAFRAQLSEGSEVTHNDLRARYEKNDPLVHHAMEDLAALTDSFYKALREGATDKLPKMIDRNFDIRASICSISRDNMHMVQTARSVGVSAKFTGSGGAIIGTYENEKQFTELTNKMRSEEIVVIKPEVVEA